MKMRHSISVMIGLTIVVLFLFAMLNSLSVDAQCRMCAAALESNVNTGNSKAEAVGLNDGIIYLLLAPYVLIGVVAFLWFRNAKKNQVLN